MGLKEPFSWFGGLAYVAFLAQCPLGEVGFERGLLQEMWVTWMRV
jgi:hypothetical protein